MTTLSEETGRIKEGIDREIKKLFDIIRTLKLENAGLREIHDERLHETTSLSIELEALKAENKRLLVIAKKWEVLSRVKLTQEQIQSTWPTNKAKLPELPKRYGAGIDDIHHETLSYSNAYKINMLIDCIQAERENNHA